MSQSVPWWLKGEEECPRCLGGYALEVEIRCVECDGPGCPFCIVTLRTDGHSCHDCDEETV